MVLLAAGTDGDDGMSIFEQVHAQTMRAPLPEMADGLYRLLTGRLTAYRGCERCADREPLGQRRDHRCAHRK
jgi:hypothetical protein